MITAPKVPPNHPDRALNAEEAIEGAIHAAMDEANRAGWNDLEIAAGVMSLAGAWLSARAEMRATEAQIAAARGA